MSYQTFLIICGILIGIPFVVSCVKGIPCVGLAAGLITMVAMIVVTLCGASMFMIHLVGFIVTGFATAKLLDD